MASERVRAAMAATDRRLFLPRTQRPCAGVDQALRIGHGATCSQPSTVAVMLDLLDARPGHAVLDVGSGSAWTTAILTRLVAPGGRVLGVELVPELVAAGRANLTRAGITGASVEQAEPARLGWPDLAPYDRILVSAEARSLPQALVDQLGDGGRMVVPVRGELNVVDKAGAEVAVRRIGTFAFVPLRVGETPDAGGPDPARPGPA